MEYRFLPSLAVSRFPLTDQAGNGTRFGFPSQMRDNLLADDMNKPGSTTPIDGNQSSNQPGAANSDTRRSRPTYTFKPQRATSKRRFRISSTDDTTIHQDVVSVLRNLIVRGDLQPGMRLPERSFCARLKISRTPLRESLRVLASEGLIELLPNRGARVAKLTPLDIQHLFEVLGCLEARAGKLACERASDAEVCEIRAIHRRMFTHFLAHRMAEYLDLNRVIHDRIVEAAHNPVLESAYHNVSNRILWACALSNQQSEQRWEAAMHEHEQIIQALEQRSGERLATLLESHLANKYEALGKQI
jgi:DNA-binding GntR family transcriptional regulator